MLTPPLSIALCGLLPSAPSGPGPREQIPWARSAGFDAVHLNVAAPGVRPRELDRSARRDLAAIIRREGLALSGADLWLPPEHLLTPAHADRALAALSAAIELIAELSTLVHGTGVRSARPVLSTLLPPELSTDALDILASAAEHAGIRIADHALPPREPNPRIEPALAIGIDPAAALAAGFDPAALVSRLGDRLASARLSDISRTVGGGRVIPGSREGRIDLLAYAVSLTTAEFKAFLCIDTRSLPSHHAPETVLRLLRRDTSQ
jgi:sugar phosphate isomerase/epimerase